MLVGDTGVGIFNKIQRELGFANKRDAIFELTKGKLTTDPTRHTGEGIFFASHMFQRFALSSEEMVLVHRDGGRDWFIETADDPIGKGTYVSMLIDPNTRRTQEVFDHYSMPQDDYAFAKTNVIVDLARAKEERLVSRSQGRRLLARFERFRELTLDFEGVDAIGPAFADEIFRVFAREHPHVDIKWIRAGEDVEKMIKRALNQDNLAEPTAETKPSDTE
jgi:hypothetical protein